jgi:flagellum-specific peptidoglycan hydrolase FlgJ
MTKLEFIDSIGQIAVKVAKDRGYGNAQVWTCIAQACCESGYGTSKIMSNANGFFGIKATGSWVKAAKYGGKVYNANTKECYDGKNYTNITACFRAYNSKEDSVRDYFDLLELSRYKSSLTRTNVQDCITDIKNGGYATSPTYVSTIMSIYNQYKNEIEKFRVDNTTTEKSMKEILIEINTLINELISRC